MIYGLEGTSLGSQLFHVREHLSADVFLVGRGQLLHFSNRLFQCFHHARIISHKPPLKRWNRVFRRRVPAMLLSHWRN